MQERSGQGAGTVRLLQFTDLHLRGAAHERLRGVDTHATFSRCLTHALATLPPPDALLLTGDLVQDDPQGYCRLAAALVPSAVPVHCLWGNHDLPADAARLLPVPPFDLAGETRLGAWTILFLDTAVPGAHHGLLGRERLAALDRRLAARAAGPILICLHHQPVPVGSRWLDLIGLRDGDALLEVVRRHDHVRGLLWGHVHQAFDAERDGLRLMGSPATCFQFAPRRKLLAIDRRPPGYRFLQLHADGRIDSQVIWLPPQPGRR